MLLLQDLISIMLSTKPVNSYDILWTLIGQQLKESLRYLKGTLSQGLQLQPAYVTRPFSITALCDADRKSTTGSAIFFGPNLISRWSCKQHVITI